MKRTSDNYDPDLADRIAYLIAGFLQGTLTPAEQDELDAWIVESDDNLELFEKLTDEDHIEYAMNRFRALEARKTEDLAALKETLGLKPKKNLWSRLAPYLVAASVLLLAVSLYLTYHSKNEKPIAATPASPSPTTTGRAVLTLSNGRTIILGHTPAGLLAEDGGDCLPKRGSRHRCLPHPLGAARRSV